MFQKYSVLSGQSYNSFLGDLHNLSMSSEGLGLANNIINTATVSSGGGIAIANQINVVQNTSDLVSKSIVQSSDKVAQTVQNTGSQIVNEVHQGSGRIVGAVAQSSQEIVGSINGVEDAVHSVGKTVLFGSLLNASVTAAGTAILAYRAKQIERAVVGLEHTLAEGLSVLSASFQVQAKVLQRISEKIDELVITLKTPMQTKAAEHRDIGMTRMRAYLYPEAATAFERAIELNETDPLSNLMIGKLLLDSGDADMYNPERSLLHFQKAERYSRAYMHTDRQMSDLYLDSMLMQVNSIFALQNEANTTQNKAELLEIALTKSADVLRLSPKLFTGLYYRMKSMYLLKDDGYIVAADECFENDWAFVNTLYRDEDFSIKHSDSPLHLRYEKRYRESVERYLVSLFANMELMTNNGVLPDKNIANWFESKNIHHSSRINKYIQETHYDDLIEQMHSMSYIHNDLLAALIDEREIARKFIGDAIARELNNIEPKLQEINQCYLSSEEMMRVKEIERGFNERKMMASTRMDLNVITEYGKSLDDILKNVQIRQSKANDEMRPIFQIVKDATSCVLRAFRILGLLMLGAISFVFINALAKSENVYFFLWGLMFIPILSLVLGIVIQGTLRRRKLEKMVRQYTERRTADGIMECNIRSVAANAVKTYDQRLWTELSGYFRK